MKKKIKLQAVLNESCTRESVWDGQSRLAKFTLTNDQKTVLETNGEDHLLASRSKRSNQSSDNIGKYPGWNNMAMEGRSSSLRECCIHTITHFLKDIYNVRYIPIELKSVIVAIPLSYGWKEPYWCMKTKWSHGKCDKIKIVASRIRNKMRTERGEKQCGFQQWKITSDTTYILRILINRAIEMQTDLYICIIDYSNAFGRVHRKEIIKMIEALYS